jgi:hypothetical protein
MAAQAMVREAAIRLLIQTRTEDCGVPAVRMVFRTEEQRGKSMSLFRTSKRLTVPRVAAIVAVVSSLGVLAVAGAGPASGSGAAAAHARISGSAHGRISPSALAFHDAMRKLWEDHITWTRNVIISFEMNEPDANTLLPDLSAALGRLLRNQADIGDAVKPFYGDAAGDQLTELLRQHILIAGDVLLAAKTGDAAGLADAQQRWYANAHEIAVFLNSANPRNWPLDEMDQMMRDHLDATTAEAVARLNSDWPGDIAAYDAVHTQALGMADMLSNGIIAQFPARFRH